MEVVATLLFDFPMLQSEYENKAKDPQRTGGKCIHEDDNDEKPTKRVSSPSFRKPSGCETYHRNIVEWSGSHHVRTPIPQVWDRPPSWWWDWERILHSMERWIMDFHVRRRWRRGRGERHRHSELVGILRMECASRRLSMRFRLRKGTGRRVVTLVEMIVVMAMDEWRRESGKDHVRRMSGLSLVSLVKMRKRFPRPRADWRREEMSCMFYLQ